MNTILTLDQMRGLSIDEIIRLYKIGYRIESNLGSLENKSVGPTIDPIVDPFVNFGKATVSQGYDSHAMTISLVNGAIFPDPSINGSFNLVWWNSTDYGDPSDDPNKEIVRCTARSEDTLTLTILRAQEGTVASAKNLSGKTYKMVLSVTAKVFADLQNVPAKSLQSATTAINISGATAPSIGQVLMATSPMAAAWQSLQQPTCFFASILGSPSSGIFPLAVVFNSTIIGGVAPYTYLWTFGDGGTSTSPAPNHNYTANGVYTARLTVTDSIGNSATSATTITVLTGVGLVANGLGISESIVMPDFLTGFNNTSANANSPFLESITITDFLAGFNNTSAYGNSPFLESITITDSLAGINNSSAYGDSPFLESITKDESLAFISSISIPATASVSKNSSTTLGIPTCYLYGAPTTCPILSWSSSNTGIATVSSTGVVTGIAIGTANITASSGVVSNICSVTVTV